jgi:hypothetical protein
MASPEELLPMKSLFALILMTMLTNAWSTSLCSGYVEDRGFTGDRRNISSAVCESAVAALISLGQFTKSGVNNDGYNHLNRVCGMNAHTFVKGDVDKNTAFLNTLLLQLEARRLTIYPNDFEALVASIANAQEADLFTPYPANPTISCSSLLYILYRIDNYVHRQ